ncbi:MAG: AAA family ATPase [Polyangiales bacterium]
MSDDVQRPPAEELFADELAALRKDDGDAPRPPGWALTPRSVVRFLLGDAKAKLAPKFVGSRAQIERCIVALATSRGLMMVGEPGTAKSYLSELLAAAISGDSTLVIQGSAGTTEDAIKYSWNYALLLAEGPTERALIPAPLHRGMSAGKLVRFEEITRCPLEIQDTLLSVLSEQMMAIPEREDSGRSLYAKPGFNVIATANTRDRGVNEMSAALKRRFCFETIGPIAKLEDEIALVQREVGRQLSKAGIKATLPADMTEVLVTTFAELRNGKTTAGKSIEPLTAVMSTAEAVAVGYAASVHAAFLGEGEVRGEHLVSSLVGTALKDNADDIPRIRHYFQQVVAPRKSGAWRDLYEARSLLPEK